MVDLPAADWTLLNANVDYWSGTTSDESLGEWADERARDYIEGDRLGNLRGSGASIQGYSGIASQHMFTGRSGSGTYVWISSSCAGERWLEFCLAGLRTSRIDLCCTLQCGVDIPTVAYSIRYDRRLPNRLRGKPARVLLLSDSSGGDTAYIGGKGSDRRGRVYDKARESPKDYALGAWRWEVQSRHKPGAAVGRDLARRNGDAGWIVAYVKTWFDDRGIYAPWTPQEGPTRSIVPAAELDDVKSYRWLQTSVAPVIARLKNRYSMNELRRAVGLLYDPNERTHTRLSR